MTDFIAKIKEIFSPNGALSQLPGFEYRKEQLDMAISVAESLENSKPLIIEAPTGVGKSFAYLVPSILFAKQNNRKAIVSTCTINLQEQLIAKDIPALASILDVDFKYEIMKGRRNYICTKRLSKAMMDRTSLFMDTEQELLQKVYDFVQKTGKGTRQDIPFRIDENIWQEIFAEEGVCTSKSCGAEDTNCFYQQAKQKMKDADLLVLNHYLFFTLFGSYERESEGYLYHNDFVIFDEAHTVEQIAAENVSPSVSREQVRFWLNKLFNPKTQKGFFANREGSNTIKNIVQQLLSENDYFFRSLQAFVLDKYKHQSQKNMVRILEPINMGGSFLNAILDLTLEIKKAATTAKNDLEESELKNHFTKFTRIRNNIITFLEQKADEHVYWVEFSGRAQTNLNLCLAPIDMAAYFRENVFTDNRMCVMTSATLSTNKYATGGMDFFKKTIGAEAINSEIISSPFDYSRQMKIYIQKSIPEPKQKKNTSELWQNTDYENILIGKIHEYITKTKGGALVLFTNNRILRKAFENLLEKLMEQEINLFAQNNGMPNNKILVQFRDDENSVLMGVDSFWMGVDIPGHSLRNVIVTKLPFDVPDHPVIEAKLEFIQEKGGNPFFDYSLPTAILKLKQGVGRLIRNKTDEGIICILDSRIITKTYGRYFIDSLPECEVVIEE
ncbi:MAG TPA: helicase C-terminal domain-containing protein [Ignavibacteria bacterium]